MKSIPKVCLLLMMMVGVVSCSTESLILPLCLPDNPILPRVTVHQQLTTPIDALEVFAQRDIALKSHITTIKRLADKHNEQFKVKCIGNTEQI